MSDKKAVAPYVFTRSTRVSEPAITKPVTPPFGKTPRAPSREGKRAVTVYLPEDAWAQLRMVTIREPGVSMQGLVLEALNDFFSKRGLNRFD